MSRTSQSFRDGVRSDVSRPPFASFSPLRASSRYRLLALSLVSALLPAAALAQQPGYGPRHSPDFLIGPPHVTLTLRGGMLFPRADSRVFGLAFQEMSLPGDTSRMFKRSDLNAPMITGELGIWTPRADVTFSLGYARGSQTVEYRHWLDNNDQPIQSWTRLAQVPMTVGVKAYLLPRGKQVGRFAFIPSTVQPYLGLAGGTVYHRYREVGDFINFAVTGYPVYTTNYVSTGWSPTVQILGGTDVSLTRRLNVQIDVRYGLASGSLASDFPALAPPPTAAVSPHDKIDLNGLQTTIGFGWRL